MIWILIIFYAVALTDFGGENDVISRYEGNIPETPDKSRVYRNRK